MPVDPLPPPQPQAAHPPTLQDLHKVIYSIKLPKSTTAKSCSVPLDDWNTIRSLVATLLQKPGTPANPDTSARISSLSTKLDALASKLDSISSQIPQSTPTSGSIPPKTYASAAASHPATSLAHHAPRDTSRDVILTPKDRRNKVFANETHHAIQQQLNTFITGSSRMNEYFEVPFVRAAAKYRNGDIRLTLQSSSAADLLMEEADHWLPAFSSLLQLRIPSFPVVMHRVPTDFNVGSGLPDSEENDVAELVKANRIHMHAGDLAKVHWIGRRPSDVLQKAKLHSSLVLHFTNADIGPFPKPTNQQLAVHYMQGALDSGMFDQHSMFEEQRGEDGSDDEDPLHARGHQLYLPPPPPMSPQPSAALPPLSRQHAAQLLTVSVPVYGAKGAEKNKTVTTTLVQMNVDPATAVLGWKESSECRRDPYHRLSSVDDLKEALRHLLALQTSTHCKKPVVMEVTNLKESKFLNYTTTLYGDADIPATHVNGFIGITNAVNHTADTQVLGWKEVNHKMHEIYNATVGIDNPIDPDTLPAKITGMNSDHVSDQKKVAHGIGGAGGWKEECDRKLHGEKELHSWSRVDLLPFIMQAAAKKVADAGGIDAFNALPLAEQDTLNKAMFVDVCMQVGKDVFDAMTPEVQRETDLFIWAGCCMHKELNAVKGGNTAMIASYVGHKALIQLMNKDNKAAAAAGSSEAKKRAEAVSEGGGVKLTSLAGMLFHHKDKKKGEGALFHIWFENVLGYDITFPDTSNTRYQSHCKAAGMLLLHRTLFLRYLEHMRDRKASRHFANLEQNIYDSLQDPETQTELLVLAAYGQSLSRKYLKQVRGPEHKETNLLALGPLHERVRTYCRAVVADPDIILSLTASLETISMDGEPWDNPELFYKIQSIQADLPRVHECLVIFFRGALETWERFTEDYAEGGIIMNLSAEERLRAWMPTTNDANGGALGELRTGSRRAPNMSLHQHNARKMYKRNDTQAYRHLLLPKSFHIIRAKARMVDSSGLTKKHRQAQNEADEAAVKEKHERDAEKAEKERAANKILDGVTPWLMEACTQYDPETQKEPTNKAFDQQFAWHRHAELPFLAKGVKSDIPMVSKLSNKTQKRAALIAAMGRYITRPVVPVIEATQEDDGMDDDVDSDVDMELSH
ncbi:hypothetical protein B0H10DRAFT_2212928 [Mycena sp. CBHHK59/15]|nr:hypothetical protein B0H10DRAFT_2212928 [Mycena sp. CBHHK59/15]